jgi:hypothetical protein
MQGIHVWYHANDRQGEPVSPERPQQQQVISLAVEVHIQVFRQLPMERIEALVSEAMEIWRSHPDKQGTMVVISPRRIAVVLDKQVNRGALVPVEMIYPAIEDATRTQVQTWLEARPTRFLVVQIAGSWFAVHESETQKGKVVDPPFLRTNMTYDTGPEPTD